VGKARIPPSRLRRPVNPRPGGRRGQEARRLTSRCIRYTRAHSIGACRAEVGSEAGDGFYALVVAGAGVVDHVAVTDVDADVVGQAVAVWVEEDQVEPSWE